MKPTQYMHVHFATFIRTTGNISVRFFVRALFIMYTGTATNKCKFTVDGTCLSLKSSTTPHPQLEQSHPFSKLH